MNLLLGIFFLLWQIVELNCSYLRFIKTHISVSCSPRKRDVCKWNECIDKSNEVAIFMHPQFRDVLSKWYQIYSGVSLLHVAHFKFEQDPLSHFQNTSQLIFFSSLFYTLCKIAITYTCFYSTGTSLQSKSNICTNFSANMINIQSVLRIKQNGTSVTPKG